MNVSETRWLLRVLPYSRCKVKQKILKGAFQISEHLNLSSNQAFLHSTPIGMQPQALGVQPLTLFSEAEQHSYWDTMASREISMRTKKVAFNLNLRDPPSPISFSYWHVPSQSAPDEHARRAGKSCRSHAIVACLLLPISMSADSCCHGYNS